MNEKSPLVPWVAPLFTVIFLYVLHIIRYQGLLQIRGRFFASTLPFNNLTTVAGGNQYIVYLSHHENMTQLCAQDSTTRPSQAETEAKNLWNIHRLQQGRLFTNLQPVASTNLF